MLITAVSYRLESVEITVELVKSGLIEALSKTSSQVADINSGGFGIPASYT
jgi:hypothetical protein